MVKVAVIGLGEVGYSLFNILKSSEEFEVYGYDINNKISRNQFNEIPRDIDFLHITYPYNEKFIDSTIHYIKKLNVKNVIIHSTVSVGTTRTIYHQINKPIAYSPTRGKHPNMKRHLMFWPKWVASYPEDSIPIFVGHLKNLGFHVKVSDKPETLELAKLFETAYRAVMIATWHEIHRLSIKFNADIKDIARFIAEIHEVLKDRPVFYPDLIGGHCLIPNTEILNQLDAESIWKFVLESNKRREKEISEENVKRDIEDLKKIYLELVPKWYFE